MRTSTLECVFSCVPSCSHFFKGTQWREQSLGSPSTGASIQHPGRISSEVKGLAQGSSRDEAILLVLITCTGTTTSTDHQKKMRSQENQDYKYLLRHNGLFSSMSLLPSKPLDNISLTFNLLQLNFWLSISIYHADALMSKWNPGNTKYYRKLARDWESQPANSHIVLLKTNSWISVLNCCTAYSVFNCTDGAFLLMLIAVLQWLCSRLACASLWMQAAATSVLLRQTYRFSVNIRSETQQVSGDDTYWETLSVRITQCVVLHSDLGSWM